jgi:hypothetical protein
LGARERVFVGFGGGCVVDVSVWCCRVLLVSCRNYYLGGCGVVISSASPRADGIRRFVFLLADEVVSSGF